MCETWVFTDHSVRLFLPFFNACGRFVSHFFRKRYNRFFLLIFFTINFRFIFCCLEKNVFAALFTIWQF
jgi:hypothetical protein